MAVPASNPTSHRIWVRTKLSPKGWRETEEDRMKRREERRGVRGVGALSKLLEGQVSQENAEQQLSPVDEL